MKRLQTNGLILYGRAFGQQWRKAVIAIKIPGVVAHGQVNPKLYLIKIGIVFDDHVILSIGVLGTGCQYITQFYTAVDAPKLVAFGRRGAPAKFDG